MRPRLQAFLDWMLSGLAPRAHLLDVGAGEGRNTQVQRLLDIGCRIYGVDPDPRVRHNPYLYGYQICRMEDAQLPPDTFDGAYGIFVVEHVADPDRFLRKVWEALKPGGNFFFITPNRNHYFGQVARLAGVLGVQEGLLTKLRGREGAEYHCHAFYRMNTRRSILRAAERAGFQEIEIRLMQSPEEILCYLPPRWRWVPAVLERVIRVSRCEWLYMNLLCRMRKPC